MDRYQLLKKLLPGLLPLIVFIIVDELYGTSAGLIVAVGFGIAQLLFTYLKDKVFDKFILFDTLLIVILGTVSYLLENDIFFKIKPALIGAILCALLGVSTFSKKNIFALMSQRYLKDVTLSEEQTRQFNRSIRVLFFLTVFHTLLVLYAAFFLSKEAWAFISTAVLYLLFGAYFGYEMLRNLIKSRKFRNEEWLPLVDEQGNVVGSAPRAAVHADKNMLHPVVHLHVVNSSKQLYLQKRPKTKLVQPGKWDTAVGGHVAVNETIETALQREAMEEIGLNNITPIPLARYVWKTDIESELVFLHYLVYDGEIQFNATEIDDGRFWNLTDLNNHLGRGTFTPNFEVELGILKKGGIL